MIVASVYAALFEIGLIKQMYGTFCGCNTVP